VPRPASAQLINTLTGTEAAPPESVLGGFDLELTLSDSTGLNAVGQNYRNELSAYFEPRWAMGRRLFGNSPTWSKLSMSARFVLGRALAGTGDDSFGSTVNSGPLVPCSSITPSQDGGIIDPNQVQRCNPEPNNRRFDYSDISVAFGLPRVATIPRVGVSVSTSLRVVIPISPQSRFASLRTALTGSGVLSKGFFKDQLRLSYSLGVTKNFHRYTTAGLDPDSPGIGGELGGNPSSGLAGVGISNLYADPSRVGASGINTSYSFSNGLSAHLEVFKKWSGDILYLWTDGFSYGHSCTVEVGGQIVDSCANGSTVAAGSLSSTESRGHKRGQVFSLTVSYNYQPWLGFSLGLSTWSPRMMPDTSYRQGFISTDYNAFTSVMLSVSTSLEELTKRWRPNRNALTSAR
jgi:hypothetical protein